MDQAKKFKGNEKGLITREARGAAIPYGTS